MSINRRQLSPLMGVLAVSVLLRIGVAFYLGDTLEETRGGTYDQISYDMLAQRIVGGHGFSFGRAWWPYARADQPTAFWSYLYSLYVAGVYLVFGHRPVVARVIQAVAVGLLMPWLVFRIGRRAFNERIGLIAAAITAVYSYFIHYAGSLMTEALHITSILWTLDVAMRLAGEIAKAHGTKQAAIASRLRLGLELGASMAVALLLRQVVVFFWAVMFLWLLWVGRRLAQLRLMLFPLLMAIVMSAVLLLPWLVRNYVVFHQLMLLPNTNSGFAFFWSNHPIHGTRFVPVLSSSEGPGYQDLIPPELRHLNEVALDRALLVRGLEFIIADPKRYVLLSLSRIPAYFLFWPTAKSTLLSNVARVLSFGLFLPFVCYGLILALRQLWKLCVTRATSRTCAETSTRRAAMDVVPDLRSRFVILILLFVVTYTGVHLASWANVRYRLPVDAVLILFAALGISDLMDKWHRLRDRRPITPGRSRTI